MDKGYPVNRLRAEITYKKLLIKAGFKEAIYIPNHYFRKETEKTAMVINLKYYDDTVGILYGFCSTAIWDESDLIEQYGIADYVCNLREFVEIKANDDEELAREMINRFYRKYHQVEKDELLCITKEKRKQFMKQITSVLKPLGFRKKGNRWIKQINDSLMFAFDVEKNTYADLYYFDVGAYSLASSKEMWCFGEQLETGGTEIFDWKAHGGVTECEFDWQLQSTEELHKIINGAMEKYLSLFMNTPLAELGTERFIWEGCLCNRDCCEECWVQKNM